MKTIKIGSRTVPLRLPKSNPKVVLGVHPAWLIRGKQAFTPVFTKYMLRALKGSYSNAVTRPNWNIRTDATAEELDAYLAASERFAFDVETPRNNHAKINLIGFSCSDFGSIVVPWCDPYIAVAKRHLERKDCTKIAHNADFDLSACEANGIEIDHDEVWCTAIGANVLEPDYPVALHLVAALYFDFYLYWKDLDTLEKQQVLWSKVLNLPLYGTDWARVYCGLDAAHTYLIQDMQRRMLEQREQTHVFVDQMDCLEPVRRMEQRGLPVNKVRQRIYMRRALKIKDELTLKVREVADAPYMARRRTLEGSYTDAVHGRTAAVAVKKQLRKSKCDQSGHDYRRADADHKRWSALCTRLGNQIKRFGRGFNVDSDDDWRWLLYEHFKMPVLTRSDKGRARINKEALQKLRERSKRLGLTAQQFEILDMLERISAITNRISTFIDVETDARDVAHPGYQLFKTATGRLASGADTVDEDKPADTLAYNAQNIPEDLRKMYGCFSPDSILLESDWEQIELRRMAWDLRVTPLVKALQRGDDIHYENAMVLYTILHERPIASVTKGERRHAKRFTHGVDYGAKARKIAALFKISVKDAQRAIDAYFTRWPGLERGREEVVARSCRARWVTQPFGWRRRVLTKDIEKILAFQPQSSSASMLKQRLPELYWGAIERGYYMLTTTHDSFLFEVTEASPRRIVEAIQWIEGVMERPFDECHTERYGDFSCPTAFSVGTSWGAGLREIKKKGRWNTDTIALMERYFRRKQCTRHSGLDLAST